MMYLKELFSNELIGIAILSWAIAQLIKIIIDVIETKKIDLDLILSSGGMPSSHSSFVVSLAMTVGFKYGFQSVFFAMSFAFCMVVMYDAAGVRRAAGKQAVVLNKILENVDKHGIKMDEKLKELLGHTPIEVAAGAVLGIVVAIVNNGLMK